MSINLKHGKIRDFSEKLFGKCPFQELQFQKLYIYIHPLEHKNTQNVYCEQWFLSWVCVSVTT